MSKPKIVKKNLFPEVLVKGGKKRDPKRTKKEKKLFIFDFGVRKEKAYFIENLSMLVEAGMDILSVLDTIGKEVRAKKMKKVVNSIRADIGGGSSLWRALDRTGVFSAYVISLIRIGEESGRLVENLKVIALREEKDRIFRSKIRAAMTYPIMVISLTVIIGAGVAWFILPRLAVVFSQLRMELPFLTRMVIGLGAFLKDYGYIAVPMFLASFLVILYFVFSFSKTKIVGQWLLFHFPGIKVLIKEMEIARFGYLLGTLLEAGLPIVMSLESLRRATIFPAYKRFYAYLKGFVEEGNSFKKTFLRYRGANQLFPIAIQQMIMAGEKSGKLPEMLIRVGKSFEAKTETTTKNLSVILEPILLIIVWVGVLIIALAVITPIYGLLGGLGR